ncbi:MAG: hypothetical protein HY898_00780 [Deltaproteobacteria bacterium]|nr:hypothetical protein [Deltaproteobacteria bacterium]
MADTRSNDRRDDDEEEEDDTKREGRGPVTDAARAAKAAVAAKAESKAKSASKAKAPDDDEDSEESAAEPGDEPEQEAEAEEPKKEKPAAKVAKKEPSKGTAKPEAKPPEPGLMTPTNIALLLATAGLGCFWKGWALYKTDGRDFYSGSAWLFVIAFFLVTVSAFHFLGAQLRPKKGEKPKGLAEAIVPALPFFALYGVIWWVAWDTWSVMYKANNHWMWMFFIALAFVSWGVWHGLRPPSAEDAKKDQLPTRRVILLLMVPFMAVYGMIWLAERVGHR